MSKTTYVWREGQLVEKPLPEPPTFTFKPLDIPGPIFDWEAHAREQRRLMIEAFGIPYKAP